MKPTDLGAGLSRRAIVGSALAMPFVRIGPARAAEFNYKLATGQSLTQPINARLEQACARIREATERPRGHPVFPCKPTRVRYGPALPGPQRRDSSS